MGQVALSLPTHFLFLLTGIHSYQCVQGAKADEGCCKEDRSQYYQYQSECSGYSSGKIKYGKYNSEHYADDTVCVTHVFFHRVVFIFFGCQ